MKHIIFIDPIEKLTVKKDTSLMMATTLKKMGHEVFVLFQENFHILNKEKDIFDVYEFQSEFNENSYYLKSFVVGNKKTVEVVKGDYVHVRIDPPFNSRYLKMLWMMKFLYNKGVNVMNAPDGILTFNEKLYAYEHECSLPTYMGCSVEDFEKFLASMKKAGHESVIIKPIDLYQGLGVEKIDFTHKTSEQLQHIFKVKREEFMGALIVQPFMKEVQKGEVRSIYFKGKEMGSIIKIPPAGEYLANIARGASYQTYELSKKEKKLCDGISQNLLDHDVPFIAFDILGGHVSEVNITCPGLVVEVSEAFKTNLAEKMFSML